MGSLPPDVAAARFLLVCYARGNVYGDTTTLSTANSRAYGRFVSARAYYCKRRHLRNEDLMTSPISGNRMGGAGLWNGFHQEVGFTIHNAKHCAAVPLNPSVRSAIGFLALLNPDDRRSSQNSEKPTSIDSSSLCKIAQSADGNGT